MRQAALSYNTEGDSLPGGLPCPVQPFGPGASSILSPQRQGQILVLANNWQKPTGVFFLRPSPMASKAQGRQIEATEGRWERALQREKDQHHASQPVHWAGRPSEPPGSRKVATSASEWTPPRGDVGEEFLLSQRGWGAGPAASDTTQGLVTAGQGVSKGFNHTQTDHGSLKEIYLKTEQKKALVFQNPTVINH